MRIFWLLRLRLYSILLGSAKAFGYIGKPIFIKGWSKIFLGKDSRIFPGARLEVLGKGAIEIDDYFRSGQNLFISTTDNRVLISKYCIFSANVFIGTQDTSITLKENLVDYDKNWFKEDNGGHDVIIGERSFIGYGASILPGTILGKCCVVGAGAVVRGVYPDNSVIALPKSKKIN